MSCQMLTSLGVYVLGAVDPAERRRVEAHLPGCPFCRAELIRLAPIPGLLASVPQDAVPRIGIADGIGKARGIGSVRNIGIAPAAGQRSTAPSASVATDGSSGRIGRPGSATRTRRTRVAGLVTALAAAAAAAAGVMLGGSGVAVSGKHPAVMLSGMNPATHVRVTAALTPASWGTRIRLTIRGAPLNVRCRLVVRSRAGRTETAGVWDAWREGPITVPASAGWRPSDIASLQVMAGARTLVTIRTARSASAHGSATRGGVCRRDRTVR